MYAIRRAQICGAMWGTLHLLYDACCEAAAGTHTPQGVRRQAGTRPFDRPQPPSSSSPTCGRLSGTPLSPPVGHRCSSPFGQAQSFRRPSKRPGRRGRGGREGDRTGSRYGEAERRRANRAGIGPTMRSLDVEAGRCEFLLVLSVRCCASIPCRPFMCCSSLVS